MNQRGDEHGLAGSREAGDAEPHRRMNQMPAEFGKRAGRKPGLFDDI
jgi:hypothetical protein